MMSLEASARFIFGTTVKISTDCLGVRVSYKVKFGDLNSDFHVISQSIIIIFNPF